MKEVALNQKTETGFGKFKAFISQIGAFIAMFGGTTAAFCCVQATETGQLWPAVIIALLAFVLAERAIRKTDKAYLQGKHAVWHALSLTFSVGAGMLLGALITATMPAILAGILLVVCIALNVFCIYIWLPDEA